MTYHHLDSRLIQHALHLICLLCSEFLDPCRTLKPSPRRSSVKKAALWILRWNAGSGRPFWYFCYLLLWITHKSLWKSWNQQRYPAWTPSAITLSLYIYMYLHGERSHIYILTFSWENSSCCFETGRVYTYVSEHTERNRVLLLIFEVLLVVTGLCLQTVTLCPSGGVSENSYVKQTNHERDERWGWQLGLTGFTNTSWISPFEIWGRIFVIIPELWAHSCLVVFAFILFESKRWTRRTSTSVVRPKAWKWDKCVMGVLLKQS